MSTLLLQLVKMIVKIMASKLTPEMVKSILDGAFDMIEDKVKDTATQWDDAIVLPMIKALRTALDVPDNDES